MILNAWSDIFQCETEYYVENNLGRCFIAIIRIWNLVKLIILWYYCIIYFLTHMALVTSAETKLISVAEKVLSLNLFYLFRLICAVYCAQMKHLLRISYNLKTLLSFALPHSGSWACGCGTGCGWSPLSPSPAAGSQHDWASASGPGRPRPPHLWPVPTNLSPGGHSALHRAQEKAMPGSDDWPWLLRQDGGPQ